MNQIPHLSRDLIDFLNRLIPLRLPSPHKSDREVWIDVGRRMAIEEITRIQEQQERGEADDQGFQKSNVPLHTSVSGGPDDHESSAGPRDTRAGTGSGGPYPAAEDRLRSFRE